MKRKATETMYETNRRYMDARLDLNNAMEEYINASRKANFPEYSIARSIADAIYDIDPNLHTEMQHEILPMVKSFQKSKNLKYDELKEDWERALIEWEQKQMWKTLTG